MSDREALVAAFHAMDAACKWAAGETGGIKTIADADRHMAGYDALVDATVKAGQAVGLLSGGVPSEPASTGLDVAWAELQAALPKRHSVSLDYDWEDGWEASATSVKGTTYTQPRQWMQEHGGHGSIESAIRALTTAYESALAAPQDDPGAVNV